jgi:hypothetical protein
MLAPEDGDPVIIICEVGVKYDEMSSTQDRKPPIIITFFFLGRF